MKDKKAKVAPPAEQKVEPKIVSAVGTSANTLTQTPQAKERAKRIEEAMRQAILDASAEGLNIDKDAAQVRERMLAARQRILDEERAG
jgi:hypothetical protein